MTITLLLNSEGKKMGKTAKGAVWLDPAKTSPFEFYQYWRNVDDADVMKCIRMLTFIPLEQIEEMEKWDGTRINEKKEILAWELTKLVHGEEEADKAKQVAASLFAGGGESADMPTTALPESEIPEGGISLMELMVRCGLSASRSDARRLIQQGGVTVDGEKAESIEITLTAEALRKGVVIRKGKKAYRRAVVE